MGGGGWGGKNFAGHTHVEVPMRLLHSKLVCRRRLGLQAPTPEAKQDQMGIHFCTQVGKRNGSIVPDRQSILVLRACRWN